MKNSKMLIVCIIVGLCFLAVYLPVRQRALKKIQGELGATTARHNDLVLANREVAELLKRYGAGADVPVFVEQMHRSSREIGITADYELSSNPKNSPSGRSGGASQKVVVGSNLAVSRMKIALHGEYRDIAEYLRLLQEDKNPKKFIDLKLVQEKGVPRLNLNLELYSYRGGNGV